MKKFSFIFSIIFLLSCGAEEKKAQDGNPEKKDTLISVADTVSTIESADSIYVIYEYKNDRLLYGYESKSGKIKIEPQFNAAGEFFNGKAPVVKGDVHGFCDTTGKIIIKLNCRFNTYDDELSGETTLDGAGEGFYDVMDENENHGFVNSEGKLVIGFDYVAVEAFSQGLAIVYVDGKAGFIDTTGKMIISPQYDDAHSFHEGLSSVRINGKYGFINKKGEMVIEPKYTEAWYFGDGLCAVSTSEEYGNYFFIDKTGKTIIKGPFEGTETFKNGKAVVMKNGRCMLIDKTGKKLEDLGIDCFAGC
ncbi:MAG: WG repeat-containing protein [Bacteroidota bacterium]